MSHTEGKLELWTSNSWRRFGTSGRDGGIVCEPVTQRSDGHPDLRFPNGGPEGPDARRMLACWNALLPYKTEKLEEVGVIGFKSHARLHEQRDELIAVLRLFDAANMNMSKQNEEWIGWQNGEDGKKAIQQMRGLLEKYPKAEGST